MKKILSIMLIIFTLFMLTGCDPEANHRQEFFNNKDRIDFPNGNTVEFNIIQLKNIMDEKTLKESNLNGGYFLFMGAITAQSSEKSVLSNTYYGYLENKSGGIYFAQIPASKVRIYEDSDTPVIIAYKPLNGGGIPVNDENQWDDYTNFNLHVPKGTIIPRVNLNLDLNKIK